MKRTRTLRAFEWVNRHAAWVTVLVLMAALGLGSIGPTVANADDPSFDPETEIFELAERADDALRSGSTVSEAVFLVESAGGGDVLTAQALREWHAAEQRVRAASQNRQHLVAEYDRGVGADVPGILSIATLVDEHLPGGLAGASDADVKEAIAVVLDPEAPTADLRFTLAESASAVPTWNSPAFVAQIRYDEASFQSHVDAELWLRDVQGQLRQGAIHTDSIGIAIDIDSTFDEAIQQSAPFIFLAVAFIVLLVAFVHRSYWSALLVAAGLGTTMLAYNGAAALIGLKMGSLLLVFIVPIAMISFGVDFYIHGVGRVREMQIDERMDRKRAYPFGMTAVFTALLLAAASSIAAFLSNAVSGTEAIVEFGIGAAIALGTAYLILGLLAPRVLMGVEEFVGANKVKSRVGGVVHTIAIVPVAIVGGLAVTLAAVMPQMGAAAVLVVIGLLVLVPAWLTRRRNARAAASGERTSKEIRGAAHGLRPVGTVVHFLAKWRAVTIPVVVLLGAAGLATAVTVKSGFELRDFLASDTEFVRSIERIEDHFPSSGEGSSYIYVEGDLTAPEALVALDEAVDALDASGDHFGRNADGALLVQPHAGDVVRMTLESPEAVRLIEESGVELTDSDGDGYPDAPEQIGAVYDYVVANGVPTADGALAIAPTEVPGIVAATLEGRLATRIMVEIDSFTDGTIIRSARDALEASAGALSAAAPVEAGVTGDVITQFESLEAFRNSMLIALPVAILLTFLTATAFLRSVRYALVSVLPIALVVTGVYAFMALAGYTVNVVTATIAAIAVGVGIDFSTHFTVRFREEHRNGMDRLSAVRRAGEGTGGALVLSAVTSVLGFTVMALAPTPIFATFGVLTAVMIALALGVALVALPSLLVVATPQRPSRPLPADITDVPVAVTG